MPNFKELRNIDFSNVISRRKMMRLSQRKVAEILGISQRTVVRWENDGHFPSWQTLDEYLDLLGLTCAFYSTKTINHLNVAADAKMAQLEERVKELELEIAQLRGTAPDSEFEEKEEGSVRSAICETLRKKRRETGLGIVRAAMAMGMNNGNLYKYEKGLAPIPYKDLVKIMNFYKIDKLIVE